MRNGARPFAILLSLAWIAFWGAVIFLLWRPEYRLGFSWEDLNALADVSAGGLTRVLATLVAIAAIAMGLPVFITSFLRQKGRVVGGAADSTRRGGRTDLPPEVTNELTDLRSRVARHERELNDLRGNQPATIDDRETESPRGRAA